MPMLSAADRTALLAIARRSLDAHVRRARLSLPRAEGTLAAPRGAFVSIHAGDDLRGCLGRLGPDAPLAHTVHDLAALVSDSDPRFAPVSVHELARLSIEISVLTPEQPAASIDDVQVGRHGLIVEHGVRRGLLLPQVATEHGWDRTTFVEHTCLKAGLPRDAWRSGARLFVFEAEVFGEADAPPA
jgi:AmmeMemoRadiSam system protein A